MVAEETPASKYSTSVVPESPGNPEGNSNISGTTFLPQDSSLEDDETDPIVIVDELSDLQSAATRLMDLFVSDASDPRNIVEAAKRLTDPRNTQSKRLKPATNKLINAMKGFSRQAFIDVAEIKQLIPSVQPEETIHPWSPSPILHQANCARLALDVLLATLGSQSPRRAIERLESQFPAPFMDAIVKKSQSKPIGASTAEKQTFELALEIRTQYFILELERRQNEKDFDPRAILNGVFYDELALEDVDSKLEPGFLRGFNLADTFEDENGCLPDRFQDDVIDRMGELEYDLLAHEDSPQIQELKRTSWTRFVQRTARFIHTRNKEIKSDLLQQPKLDEVHDLLMKEIERRENGTPENPNPHESAVPASVEHLVHKSPVQPNRQSPRETSTTVSPERTRQPLGESNLPYSSPVSQPAKKSHKNSERRESAKISRMLTSSLDSLAKRKETILHNQDLSHLESQHTSRLSTTSEHTSSQLPVSRTRDEIPPSPEPASSQPRYPRRESVASDDQDLNFRNDDETLNLDTLENEAEATASPVMRRTKPRDLFFSSSSGGQLQGSQDQDAPPQSNEYIWNSLTQTQTQPQAQQAQPQPQPQPRAFIDRQADATRISWTESVDGNPESAQRRRDEFTAPTNIGTRKRPRVDSDDDSDDDGDFFVNDDRTIDPASRRAQKPEQAQTVRRNSSNLSADAQLQQGLNAAGQTQPPASTPPSSQVDTTQAMMNEARHREQTAQSSIIGKPAKKRPRKRWTPAEEDKLMWYIETTGTSWHIPWAEIKSKDSCAPNPLWVDLSQPDIKDKARNIRHRYIREGREHELHDNWKAVTIDSAVRKKFPIREGW
ncbi:FAD-binding type 2 [Penicillium atrosanguineum]|uniref:FAD-binding type 2 n=1 Tax=Penicillium atrosanguineum TaxID=1132637 RepID=UPI0023864A14|nr:FAD-binding type 2 [Penicillium atrosanguineum]KAJ5296951.1 FAD-binding type 2 [Penicillium atrosanguineum]